MSRGRPSTGADPLKRLTILVPTSVDNELRRLAEDRFIGNLSKTVSWAIGLASATLDGPLAGLQHPHDPALAVTNRAAP